VNKQKTSVNPNASITPGQVDAKWYTLQSSSPAIGAASTINGIADDFFGDNMPLCGTSK